MSYLTKDQNRKTTSILPQLHIIYYLLPKIEFFIILHTNIFVIKDCLFGHVSD